MMQTEIVDVRTYRFKKEDRVLLDANIWLHIDGPDPHGWETEVYSEALKQILISGSAVYFDVMILSEFINRYVRLHQKWAGQDSFKDFRKIPGYRIVAESTAAAARRIMKRCRLVASSIAASDMESLLNTFESQRADFNDLVIAETCRCEGLVLVTHDGDFRSSGLRILTANQALLGA